MNRSREFVLHKLEELEQELKTLGLWGNEPLTEEQMSSSAPFGCDLMDFHQWLQHLFIPKLAVILRRETEMSIRMSVAEMAEYVYRDEAQKYSRLIGILKVLDRSVNMCR